ncbi:hypothetical protein SAMN06265377_3723 [Flagellimonas pacifica]|uniref:Uncharacterized protein n=1 Tax=Flagellimonas pacifica TaxID=1247520 RepID=A0A285MYX0_9FLAO|nr:hypothetical protein SAMN06265377_3723 [Allomuricauda parva]
MGWSPSNWDSRNLVIRGLSRYSKSIRTFFKEGLSSSDIIQLNVKLLAVRASNIAKKIMLSRQIWLFQSDQGPLF